MDGKGKNEKRPKDEGRNADADHRNGRAHVIEPTVALHGGEGAEGNANDEGDGERDEAELEGGGELVADDLVDGAIGVFEGRAEVAAEETSEVVEVLPVERFIEAVVGLEIAEDFRGDGFFGGERAAGHEADHEERRRDDDQKNGDDLK